MSKVSPIRILMYSHDTFGLGHITRTLRIASAIRRRTPRASILVLSGSPVAPYVPLPPGADLVKLPSVSKSGADRYESRSLAVNFSQIKRMRRDVILSTAETFRPHLFLVDNVPLGMKGEILPTLEFLREKRRDTRIILNLRDILDAPEVIQENWKRSEADEILKTHYDQIYVLGDPSFFDAAKAYQLPADHTLHVGYATPEPRRVRPDIGEHRDQAARILLSAGGGGDGYEFLSTALEGLGWIPGRAGGSGLERSVEIEVVTGPLMEPKKRIALGNLAACSGARIEEFVPDMPQRIAGSDLVVAMAGYNTCCDILSHGNKAVLYPRITPRVEQLIRARVFESRGLALMLSPDRMEAGGFAEAAERALRSTKSIDDGDLPQLGGLERLADHLVSNHTVDGEHQGNPPHGNPMEKPAGPLKLKESGNGGAARLEQTYLEAPVHSVWYWPDRVLGGGSTHA